MMVAALASAAVHGLAASIPPDDDPLPPDDPDPDEDPEASPGDASSIGVAAGVLEDEQPTSATAAPTSEVAANPIKYREARIG
jgi:hypothetical protein